MNDVILVTGGAGFIGCNFIRDWFAAETAWIVNLDALTYAGNAANLPELANHPRYRFTQGDVNDLALVARLLAEHRPRAVVHFAAESHVDRSIRAPDAFLRSNVAGTFHLLEAVRSYWDALPAGDQSVFRFLHVSTDEVYGSLAPGAPPFTEAAPYAPNSPYAASKAASDHFVRAWHHTYGVPTLTTHCSNNYGPWQFPEKFVPLMVVNAIAGKPLPVYGDGLNVRDWLYVADHCQALRRVLAHGRSGETYNIGGHCERTNLEVVQAICALLDELHPQSCPAGHASLISFVADRPGHDRRYAIDASKMERELGWRPSETFESGLRRTVVWLLENRDWLDAATSGDYTAWIARHYQNQA